MAIESGSIFKGIIWKTLITYYLIYGIKTAKAEEAKSNEYMRYFTDILGDIEV